METKTEKKNIFQNLAEIRVELSEMEIKKSGWNKYSKYWYFQLDDFINIVKKMLLKRGIFSYFNIYPGEIDEDGVITKPECAVLELFSATDRRDRVIWETPTADACVKGATPIQALGSKHTYMRRYLWMEALELAESDGVDGLADDQKDPTPQPQQKTKNEKTKTDAATQHITREMIKQIISMYSDERINKMLEFYQVNALQDLSITQGLQIIDKGKKEHGA